MRELIEVIGRAVGEGATAEAKAAGAAACRTILAALETEAGQPMAAGSTLAPDPLAALAGLDIDRALDLVIARLRAAVPEERRAVQPSQGVRIQLVPVPKGR